MLDSTIELIRAGLKTDPTLSSEERTRLVAMLRHHGKPMQPPPTVRQEVEPKVIQRKQAAERLNSSLRLIDLLAKQGVLKKCVLPGRRRAVGLLESNLSALMAK
jgi:hypothetical protein